MEVHHSSITMRSIDQNVLMWVENVPKFLIDSSNVVYNHNVTLQVYF